jgi:hypothetical protein
MEYHFYFWVQGRLSQKAGYETSTKRKEDGSGDKFQLIIPAYEIPRWLTHQRMGNSINIELPPNWCNSRWMRFTLCACLDEIDLHPDEYIFDLLDEREFYVSGERFDHRANVKANVIALGDMPHSDYTFEIFSRVTFGRWHMWLSYLSRDSWFATVQNGECSQIKVSFETHGDRLVVWNCGVRLVYEQDVEFNQTECESSHITTCRFRPTSSADHQSG